MKHFVFLYKNTYNKLIYNILYNILFHEKKQYVKEFRDRAFVGIRGESIDLKYLMFDEILGFLRLSYPLIQRFLVTLQLDRHRLSTTYWKQEALCLILEYAKPEKLH